MDAMEVLDLEWEMIRTPETEPDWRLVEDMIRREASTATRLIVPAYEIGGHEHHNVVAMMVAELDHPNVVHYFTYQRGRGRTMEGRELRGTIDEEDAKLRALLCYRSQIADPATAPWFPGGAYHDMREWIA